ncbi:MAG: glycosyltransferase, partial [Salibacteraceae bacterium]
MDEKPFSNVILNDWRSCDGVKIFYATKSEEKKQIRKSIASEKFDIIYLNSFFSFPFAIYPLMIALRYNQLTKVVLAPRGMLGEGALKFKKVKKQLFIWGFKIIGIQNRIRFHATDRFESLSIKKALGQKVEILEVKNIPVQVIESEKPKFDLENAFIFASRISPKKNLLWLIERFERIASDSFLNIYGEADDIDYIDVCRSLIKTERIVLHGAIPPDELRVVFEKSGFFVLPTHNENFGHAIIEAKAAGCPV